MKRRLDHLVLAHECDAVPPALRQRYTWPYYEGKVATLVDPQKPDKPLFLKRTKKVFEVESLRIFGSTPMPADQVLFVPKLRRVTTQLNELNFSTQVEELAGEKIGSHLRNDKTWWMLMENPFPARCVFTLSLTDMTKLKSNTDLQTRAARDLAIHHLTHGVAHRDLHSANVMMADDGSDRVLLIDFGSARAKEEVTNAGAYRNDENELVCTLMGLAIVKDTTIDAGTAAAKAFLNLG